MTLPDIRGWLSEAEGAELERLARGRRVLEVGSMLGLSTVVMGRVAEFVVAVDPFDRIPPDKVIDTLPAFRFNVIEAGCGGTVFPFVGRSERLLPLFGPYAFDLAYLDGDHTEDGLAADVRNATRVVRPGGEIAFHDYGREHLPAVKKVVDRWRAGRRMEVIDTLAVVTL